MCMMSVCKCMERKRKKWYEKGKTLELMKMRRWSDSEGDNDNQKDNYNEQNKDKNKDNGKNCHCSVLPHITKKKVHIVSEKTKKTHIQKILA